MLTELHHAAGGGQRMALATNRCPVIAESPRVLVRKWRFDPRFRRHIKQFLLVCCSYLRPRLHQREAQTLLSLLAIVVFRLT